MSSFFQNIGKLFNQLPVQWKENLKAVYFDLGEAYDRIAGKNQDMIPPRRMIFVGRSDFQAIGNHFLKIFIDKIDLKKNARILDIGCGIGRIAVPLTGYLDDSGSYEGFDIVRTGIRWCKMNITPKYPNFRFQHVDVFNETYNPQGKIQSKDLLFPYPKNEFDFIFLTSVFTHMLPKEIEQYISEINRVLKPGGDCLMTFFLINNNTKKAIETGESELNLSFAFPGFFSTHATEPEKAIGLEEEYVRNLCAENYLKITQTHYGSWSGNTKGLSYQDILILKKDPV